MKKYLKRIIATIPMIAIMIIIYGFSAGTGEESGSLSLIIAEFVSDTLSHMGIDVSAHTLHTPIRKLAHMSEYACLAITTMWAFYGFKKRYGIALAISVMYAILDEIHQLNVPGRYGCVTDVLIDTVGVLIGLGVYKVVTIIVNLVNSPKKAH